MQVIAERKLLFSEKGTSERQNLTIRVGVPYWVNKDFAACPLEWAGLVPEGELAAPMGYDLIQAIRLATDVDAMVRGFGDKYDFFWPDGEPYEVD